VIERMREYMNKCLDITMVDYINFMEMNGEKGLDEKGWREVKSGWRRNE